jgi:hypothetical protein
VLTGIVFDALDVATMERFWTMATGGQTSGLRLRFEATDQQKTAKNRLHLCLAGGPGSARATCRGTCWPIQREPGVADHGAARRTEDRPQPAPPRSVRPRPGER